MRHDVGRAVDKLQANCVFEFFWAREGVGAECAAHAKMDADDGSICMVGVVAGGEKVKQVFPMDLNACKVLVIDCCCTCMGMVIDVQSVCVLCCQL